MAEPTTHFDVPNEKLGNMNYNNNANGNVNYQNNQIIKPIIDPQGEQYRLVQINRDSKQNQSNGNLQQQVMNIKLKRLSSNGNAKNLIHTVPDDVIMRTEEPLNKMDNNNLVENPASRVYTQEHKRENQKRVTEFFNDSSEEQGTGFEDGKLTKALFSQFLQIEQSCATLAIIGLALGIIQYDLEFDENQTNNISVTLCWIITLTTIFLVLLTIMRYQTQMQWYKARQVISQKDNLYTTGDWLPMLLEIILIGFNPTPWTVGIRITFDNPLVPGQEVYYHVNEILVLIMLLRVFFIVRTILMSTYWFSNRTHRVCFMYACESNYIFVIKCIMKTQPYILIVSAMIGSIFFFGAAIRICQSPLNRGNEIQKFESYANSMWNIIVTMTTVGYGDYFPSSGLGRFIIFTVCIWGVFIVSMMVITLINTLEASSLEQKAMAVLERLELKKEMREIAGHIITLLGKFYILSKAKVKNRKLELDLVLTLRKKMSEFKILSRNYRSIGDDNFSEEMGRQFDFMRDDFNTLFDKHNVLLQACVDMMDQLNIEPEKIQEFKKSFMKKSMLKSIEKQEDETQEAVKQQEDFQEKADLMQQYENENEKFIQPPINARHPSQQQHPNYIEKENLLSDENPHHHPNQKHQQDITGVLKGKQLNIDLPFDHTNMNLGLESNQNTNSTPQFLLKMK